MLRKSKSNFNRSKKRKKSAAQIATILTLVIAAVFLFVVITINVRRVTQRKTVLDNAADGAALFLASNLGSLGNKIAQEYLDGKTEDCDIDWLFLGSLIALIAGIIFSIFIPVGWPVVIAGIAKFVAGSLVVGGLLTLGGTVAHIVAIEPKQFENFSLYFKQMTAEQQLIEGAIQYAAFGSINDLKEITDVHDDDGDTYKDDKILRFTKFYYERLRGLPSLGALIREFVLELRELVVTEENVDDWEIIDTWIPDPPDAGITFESWLSGEFISLLQLMQDVGYGVSFWSSGDNNDDVDQLIIDIEDFGDWANNVLKVSPDERLVGFEQWHSQLIHPGDPDDDWQERIIEWRDHLDAWIAELEAIQENVQECVDACCNKRWECDSHCGGSCCAERCGEYSCWCVAWEECCGEEVCCCGLCGDAQCPPHGTCCSTCCYIQDNCSSETSKIVRAVEDHLKPLREKVSAFCDYLPGFEVDVTDFYRELGQSRELFYEWTDSLGLHNVTVSIEDLPDDFKGPYLAQERHWLGFQKCTVLKNHSGSFRVVISRYDREAMAGLKGLLDLLNWNRTITSEAKAEYGIDKENIRLMEAE